MNDFWYFAKRILYYRGLLAAGFAAALVDALCAFGGFGTLMWVVDQFFKTGDSVRDLARDKLSHPRVEAWLGDPAALVQWIPEGRFGGLAFLLGVILLFSAFGACMRFAHQVCVITAGLRTVMRIRRDAFQRMIHAPLEQVLQSGSADNLSRIVRDASQLGRGFNALFARAVRDILFGAAMLALALLVNWQLTLLFLISGPIVYTCIRKFGKRIRRATRRALKAYGEMVGSIQEAMQGLPVVKVHGAEGYERRRFNAINRRVLAQELRARIARAMSTPAIELVGVVGFMGVALIAAWFVLRPGGPAPREMVWVLGFLGIAGTALKPLANLNNALQEAAAGATRLRQMLELPVEPIAPDQPAGPKLPRHQQNVSFENITYTYPESENPALCGINLRVSHGETVAIVGPNGSGKSTLINLLPRLLVPDEGTVRIDDRDIAEVSLRSLRDQMAAVTQQTVLFAGTIADNIAYGQRHLSRQRLEEAARTALADEFIAALPEGYDTYLGEGGVGLSGGQRQRLAIARAILRDPSILILDEATSQIDADSEDKIVQALDRIRLGRTTFVIAHRLSTVVDADRIVVMQNGRIVDEGDHQTLLDRSETYANLARRQLQPAATPPDE